MGFIWVVVATVVVAAPFGVVSSILYSPPDIWKTNEVTLTGVRGAILLAVLLSLAAYLVSLFVRLAVSSFHLARDSRERYQLTHVFLALIKEAAIDEKDRDIILSAIFSRADTGLLKHDGSPTMPTPLSAIVDAFKK